MILLAMVSLLVGALLAQRFRIMVLVPATTIMLGAVVGTGVAHAHTVWWMILMVGTAATSMQVGYLVVGSGVRHVLAGVLSSRPSHVPSTRYNAR